MLKKADSPTVAANNAGYFCGIVTVSGSVTSVVNPATAAVPDGTITFSFDIGTLQMAAAVRWWEQLKMPSDSTPALEAIQNPGTSQPASVFHMTKKMIVFVRRQNSTKPWRSGGQDCFHGRAGGAVAVFGALW